LYVGYALVILSHCFHLGSHLGGYYPVTDRIQLVRIDWRTPGEATTDQYVLHQPDEESLSPREKPTSYAG
jgi:hypothetical protein